MQLKLNRLSMMKTENLKIYNANKVGNLFAKQEENKMKTPINIREITHKEFNNLKSGDIVFVKCSGHTFQSTVVRPPFYNYDVDEPDWEVETTNGYCDEYSLYVYA